VGKILEKAEGKNYSLLITSDHGNCEEMEDAGGNILTNHTVGDVYCFLKADGVDKINDGGLNNIAPTILKMMDLEIPEEMDAPLNL
jgi:2,3-bisphosphoglycerate-independent phosphoglycerate mutase